ncbi:MAG: hypothetical protein IKF49_07110 [Clostridia bacterium]|jgi:hypothetical protein|nr:hypothetical protein [Clostridia bacterium]
MASTGKCQYCGSTISSEDQKCPSCGAPNPNYVEPTERQIFLPKTIEELKEYCAQRGMPLLRMRFFIGEDFREPKAFGIYREGDEFIVYKNKSDGSRAIRYRGPDEKYAVNELFLKLLDECHNRGIYPDGAPSKGSGNTKKGGKGALRFVLIYLAFVVAFSSVMCGISRLRHKNDGYYQFDDSTVYYHYGDNWYYTYTDNDAGYWYPGDAPVSEYQDYSIGTDYESDWGISNFQDSSTYEALQESNSSSSSDYDSWDSGGTDWDSDW